MRLTSTMGAAGLLKALALALCLFGSNGSDAAAKKAARHAGGISQRVQDLVAKMVSAS